MENWLSEVGLSVWLEMGKFFLSIFWHLSNHMTALVISKTDFKL